MFQHRPLDPIIYHKSEDPPFLLPGYGRPLDYAPFEKNVYGVESRSMFPTALDDRDIVNGYTEMPIQTLREMEMVKVMEEITDIPEWWKKIQDPAITEEWRQYALTCGRDVTENMANWIIDELRYKAMIYEYSRCVGLYNGDITKSDTNVPTSLVEELKAASMVLENDSPVLQFYYPGSMSKQRDLLAMALYPLVYGKTRILPDRTIRLEDALQYAGQGEVIPCPKETGITREDIAWRVSARADIKVRPYSRFHQVLPADLESGEDGRWHIKTYINNLHPVKHKNMYKIIEDVFNCLIPQWEATMTPLKDMLHSRSRIEYHKAEYHPVAPEIAESVPQILPREAQSEYEERYENWRMKNYKAVQPDACQFFPWAVPLRLMSELPEDLPSPVRIEQGVDLCREYKDRGLQVITRILGVDLTPEDSYYETEFHVEGQMNEHICAAAFLTFSNENMKDYYMEFRNIIETAGIAEVEHEPNDFVWLRQIFGLDNGEPAVQNTGKTACKVGRVVMFPSTVQHRMTGFELEDKSKPGRIRMLVFYLVDPNIRIISTANVPPQRLDWTLDVDTEELDLNLAMAKLALDHRTEKGSMPMSLDDALETRNRLLEELFEFMKYQHVAFESNIIQL